VNSPWVNDANAALLTDLYELTMLQAYFESGANETAVFDLFMRRLPPMRNYFVACGLEHVLTYLETLSFSADAVEYLQSLGQFTPAFLASLRDFRFAGDVYAVPEGTVVFPQEPLVEVVAPLPQAQIVETFLMNQIQIATITASKASRVVYAAKGRSVVDFGLRRMHGADAAMKAARAYYIAGVDATSNVLAGKTFDLPVSGTMAHSYIQSFVDELEAFRSFLHSYPDAIILVDTYDTIRGVRHVVELAKQLGPDFRASGVRLDSGDLLELSRQARSVLDEAGLGRLKIYASGDLDEYAIDRLLQAGAPVDGFGVGARMGTSSDAPYLDTAYKLVEYAGRPTMKLSKDKRTLPGRKQVFRRRSDGTPSEDVIGLANEKVEGEPLLEKVMENGRRTTPSESIVRCRSRCQIEVGSLPALVRALGSAQPAYRVSVSPGLTKLQEELSRDLAQ